MTEKELIAEGIGDVPAWLAEEGLELAKRYFEDNNINPSTCFAAKDQPLNNDLATHWKKAEKLANTVLTGDTKYENAMIILDYDIY